MSKGGRPFIADAVRYACGKINRSETEKLQAAQSKERGEKDKAPPSAKVKRNRDIFNVSCFKGGGHGNHAGDAIGQLWLLGKLDIPDMDETKLLDAARAWWHGRSIMFKGLDYKTARFERASRSSSQSTRLSRAERDYEHYDRMLADADQYDQDCLASLMETTIDDNFPSWVSRIIQTELLRHIRLPLVELATDRDLAMLEAAKRALLAMAGATALRQAA
jgi:hypothetical protein